MLKVILRKSHHIYSRNNLFSLNVIVSSRNTEFIKCRQLSSQIRENPQEQQQQQTNENKSLTNEGKIYAYKDFDLPEKLEMEPIRDLNVISKINKVRKESSFIGSLFLGKFDIDFLTFPEVLYGRKDFLTLIKQSEMIQRNFKTLLIGDDNQEKLNRYRFNYLWQLSKSEMINIFESIGASLTLSPNDIEKSIEDSQLSCNKDSNNSLNRLSVHPLVYPSAQQLIFKLILHNSLSMNAVKNSKNVSLKERLSQQSVDNSDFRLAFAWSELIEQFGSLPYPDWETKAKLTHDKKSWVLTGKKTRILKDNYDYYIVFAHVDEFPDNEIPYYVQNVDKCEGIVGLLLPAAEIAKRTIEVVNGVEYETIEFNDISLPREDFELIPADEFAVVAQNLKGVGQVAVASFLLGQCKTALNTLYSHLIEKRKPFLECELIESILANITQDIYKLESVVYMVAAMYDSFDERYPSHVYLEAATCKTLAVEISRNTFQQVQSIYGSKCLHTSPVIDLINIMESFLDSNLHNRLLLGLQGSRIFGQYKHENIHKLRIGPFYPAHVVSYYLRNFRARRDRPKLNLELKGYLHPSLQDCGDQLEYCLKRFEYVVELTMMKWAKAILEHQCDLYRMSQIAMDIFALTCVLARASRSFSDGTRNGDMEIKAAESISMDTFLHVRKLVDDLERSDFGTNEIRNEDIHKRNIKFNGYFAYSPLDKTFF